MTYTVGCDPEVFLQNKQGEIVSAIPYLEGVKGKPQEIEHGFLHSDNVLAELNPNPASNLHDFLINVRGAMQDLQEIISPHGLNIAILSSHEMDQKYLDHPLAQQFGCEPDMDVWTMTMQDGINPSKAGNLRTAGGHIHIGLGDDFSPDNVIKTARRMEFYVGLPSVILDKDKRRRSLYGASGRFRPKPEYGGLEYRVLSNFWLSKTYLMEWVFNAALGAASGGHIRDEYIFDENLYGPVRRAIDTHDVTLARELMSRYGIYLPSDVGDYEEPEDFDDDDDEDEEGRW